MKPTLYQNFADTQWGRSCEEEGQGRRGGISKNSHLNTSLTIWSYVCCIIWEIFNKIIIFLMAINNFDSWLVKKLYPNEHT